MKGVSTPGPGFYGVGILMLISAVIGLILVSAAYAMAFVLLTIGGIFALLGQKELAKINAARDTSIT